MMTFRRPLSVRKRIPFPFLTSPSARIRRTYRLHPAAKAQVPQGTGRSSRAQTRRLPAQHLPAVGPISPTERRSSSVEACPLPSMAPATPTDRRRSTAHRASRTTPRGTSTLRTAGAAVSAGLAGLVISLSINHIFKLLLLAWLIGSRERAIKTPFKDVWPRWPGGDRRATPARPSATARAAP
jgi:hypothetical protein